MSSESVVLEEVRVSGETRGCVLSRAGMRTCSLGLTLFGRQQFTLFEMNEGLAGEFEGVPRKLI